MWCIKSMSLIEIAKGIVYLSNFLTNNFEYANVIYSLKLNLLFNVNNSNLLIDIVQLYARNNN